VTGKPGEHRGRYFVTVTAVRSVRARTAGSYISSIGATSAPQGPGASQSSHRADLTRYGTGGRIDAAA
jgi:hypothetical protein